MHVHTHEIEPFSISSIVAYVYMHVYICTYSLFPVSLEGALCIHTYPCTYTRHRILVHVSLVNAYVYMHIHVHVHIHVHMYDFIQIYGRRVGRRTRARGQKLERELCGWEKRVERRGPE